MSPTGKKSTNGRTFPWYLRLVRGGFAALERVAPAAVGPVAVRLFRAARRHPTPDRERVWLATATPFHFSAGGRRLAAWSWGDGPTVLLVHGWEGRGSQMAAFAAPLVEAGYRVVAFDAPGHGASEGRQSSLPEFSEAVVAAAEAAGPLAAVVAHSFGAAATGWGLVSGLAAERLVFVGAPFDLHEYIHFFSSLLGLSERGRERLLASLERKTEIDWARARYATTTAADATPLLVVHDEDDAECPVEGGRAIASAWPKGELLETRGLGHTRILRDPTVVGRVTRFVVAGRGDAAAGGETAAGAAPTPARFSAAS